MRLTKKPDYAASNRQCAEIIAADPVQYPPGSLMAIWAEEILLKKQNQAPAPNRANQQQQLFGEEAA